MGEPFDQALQLTYLRARYLNPVSGRFWTMDSAQGNPFDPPSLHRYLFADGDPVNKFDPFGLATMGMGNMVHLFVGMDFMADGFYKNMFGRMSGTGRGRRSLGKILFGRLWNPTKYAFENSRGFPDLTDFNSHFMMEIKTRSERAQGAMQLNKYVFVYQPERPLKSAC